MIIVQQDDFLIFPGDMAFEVICKDSQEVTLEATIELADPDPGAKKLPESKRKSVSNQSGKVTFLPKEKLIKEELWFGLAFFLFFAALHIPVVQTSHSHFSDGHLIS